MKPHVGGEAGVDVFELVADWVTENPHASDVERRAAMDEIADHAGVTFTHYGFVMPRTTGGYCVWAMFYDDALIVAAHAALAR